MCKKSLAIVLLAVSVSITTSAVAQGRAGEGLDRRRPAPIIPRVVRFISSVLGFEPTPPHP